MKPSGALVCLKVGPALRRSIGGVAVPRIDVSETDQDLKVFVELPGVDQNDVEITLTDDVLTIRGEKKARRREPAAELPCDGADLWQLRPLDPLALHGQSRSGPGDLQGRC